MPGCSLAGGVRVAGGVRIRCRLCVLVRVLVRVTLSHTFLNTDKGTHLFFVLLRRVVVAATVYRGGH